MFFSHFKYIFFSDLAFTYRSYRVYRLQKRWYHRRSVLVVIRDEEFIVLISWQGTYLPTSDLVIFLVEFFNLILFLRSMYVTTYLVLSTFLYRLLN